MKHFFLWVIDLYSKLSWLRTVKHCRFYPTCSVYAKQAIEHFGVLKGLRMSIWRILRCNSFSKGGYDPVYQVKNH
ncbi:MAG: membrane protein insertion efficiency factor YidD [Oscillospiraceae bacterium]|nr:membrane protein insertion efficiency factor YidD [Oscillospiraceae bacterium]